MGAAYAKMPGVSAWKGSDTCDEMAVLNTCTNAVSGRFVIPAKAGIHALYWRWIPAFAGMTYGGEVI